MTPNDPNQPLTEAERNAMRSYLQRAEVRLSSLHRIATAFISGAGLLIMLPAFFNDEVSALIRLFLQHMPDFTAQVNGTLDFIVAVVVYLCLVYLLVLSFSIPLYALYMMLKDIVHFYFTIYTPGFPSELKTPSFALSGIAFSPDESERVKAHVLQVEYGEAAAVNFAIPFSPTKRAAYLDETIRETDGEIIPASRRWETLAARIPADTDRVTADRFSAAMGLARTLDRQLVDEVATSEISLVRHIIYLRRLVLRYVKTLILFIWTAIVTFLMLPFAQDERLPVFLVLSVGYFIWAVLVTRIMRMPLGWIYRHLRGIPDEGHIDHQLVILESQVRYFCYAAVVAAIIALALSTLLYLK